MMEKGGSFVTTSSVGGMWPLAQDRWVYTQTAYAVAKAGLIMLTKAAAQAVRTLRHPGERHLLPATTALRSRQSTRWRKWSGPSPGCSRWARCGMPEEMKGLAVWLASDASSFVTGQILVEDGGYSA